MNREIKFRAWDNERKMFVPEGEIVFANYGETRIEVVPNCMEYVGDSVHNGEPQRGRFSVTQFTGLKDRNGEEIYEGDIVGYGDNYPCEIKWDNNEYMWEAVEYGNEDGIRRHSLTAYTVPFVVLGNVYQNSELLKKQGL